jgi:hypothetical protein
MNSPSLLCNIQCLSRDVAPLLNEYETRVEPMVLGGELKKPEGNPTSSPTHLVWSHPELNQKLHVEKPTRDRLNYDTASKVLQYDDKYPTLFCVSISPDSR